MANVDGIVQEGIAAIKAGRKDEAKRLLNKAVDLDERNEQAWLWLSACVETLEEQQICLENVLSINPANTKARKGLEALAQKTGQQAPPPASGYDSNPFAGTGFDSNPYGGGSDPAFGSSWQADSAFPTPSSSVEWTSDKPPTSGSGKNVQLPSTEEYDSWVTGLQLGGAQSSEPGVDSRFDSSSGPFGASSGSFDDVADPFAGSSFDSGPFNKGLEDAAFPDTSSTSSSSPFTFGSSEPPAFRDDPFAGASSGFDDADPFGSSAFGSNAKSDPFAAAGPAASDSADDLFESQPPKKQASGRASMFDDSVDDLFSPPPEPARRRPAAFDNDPLADLFLETPAKPASKRAGRDTFGNTRSNVFGGAAEDDDAFVDDEPVNVFGGRSSGMSPYFKSIPQQIQVGGENVRLMLGVVALAVLNAVSLAFLFLNLTRR